MEYKDPMVELLSNLEQIVFKEEISKTNLTKKPCAFNEFEQLRRGTGLKIDDFARVFRRFSCHGTGMGVQTSKTFQHRTKIDATDPGQPGVK